MDASHHPHRPTILVVEDDLALRELVHDALTDEGFRVVAATNHADALIALKAVKVALVLTDTAADSVAATGSPWVDLDPLRQAAGAVPTVIFSAHNPDLFAGYAARGFAGFIAKPFDLDTLLDTVRRYAS